MDRRIYWYYAEGVCSDGIVHATSGHSKSPAASLVEDTLTRLFRMKGWVLTEAIIHEVDDEGEEPNIFISIPYSQSMTGHNREKNVHESKKEDKKVVPLKPPKREGFAAEEFFDDIEHVYKRSTLDYDMVIHQAKEYLKNEQK